MPEFVHQTARERLFKNGNVLANYYNCCFVLPCGSSGPSQDCMEIIPGWRIFARYILILMRPLQSSHLQFLLLRPWNVSMESHHAGPDGDRTRTQNRTTQSCQRAFRNGYLAGPKSLALTGVKHSTLFYPIGPAVKPVLERLHELLARTASL
jgi:hypothetical protein